MSVLPVDLPREKRQLLETVVAVLQGVANGIGLALGGSYARGVAEESSDLDIGIYYREAAPLAVAEVRSAVASICAPGTLPVVTELYGWGPWVNGGAWIQTPVTKVDLVYRNLDQVHRVLDEGARGICRHDYDQQPPFGFRSVVYFAETHYCIPLHDPEGEIARLKRSVAVYPALLKSSILRESLWGAEFSLWSCDRFAAAADSYNAVGCMTRAANYLLHALFALNEEYLLNDKQWRRIVTQFATVPDRYAERLAAIFSHPGQHASELLDSLHLLRELWAETVTLTNGAYEPRFDLTSARKAIQSS